MSYDYLLFRVPDGVRTVDQLSEDALLPLGSSADLRQAVQRAFPQVRFRVHAFAETGPAMFSIVGDPVETVVVEGRIDGLDGLAAALGASVEAVPKRRVPDDLTASLAALPGTVAMSVAPPRDVFRLEGGADGLGALANVRAAIDARHAGLRWTVTTTGSVDSEQADWLEVSIGDGPSLQSLAVRTSLRNDGSPRVLQLCEALGCVAFDGQKGVLLAPRR